MVRLLQWLPALLVAGWLLWPGLRGSYFLNRGYVELVRAGWESAEAAPRAASYLGEAADAGQVSALWGTGMLARWQGNEAESRSLWLDQLSRSPAMLSLLYTLYRQDIPIAERAHELYPDNVLAAFWLGEAVAPQDLPRAIALYERALAMTPLNAVRWVELGWHYRHNQQYEAALAAYDRGCVLRDRGGNGCWQAGLLSQELGLNQQAADYYRLTLRQIPDYAPALERLTGLGE